MKKFAKVMALMLVVIMSVAMLVSCGVSEKTAEKINDAANKGEPMSYDEVKRLCGGEQTSGKLVAGVGVLTWISGCKTLEEAQKKLEDGKTVKALTVTFAGGKAVTAVYNDLNTSK